MLSQEAAVSIGFSQASLGQTLCDWTFELDEDNGKELSNGGAWTDSAQLGDEGEWRAAEACSEASSMIDWDNALFDNLKYLWIPIDDNEDVIERFLT